jgi:hypothetical protein
VEDGLVAKNRSGSLRSQAMQGALSMMVGIALILGGAFMAYVFYLSGPWGCNPVLVEYLDQSFTGEVSATAPEMVIHIGNAFEIELSQLLTDGNAAVLLKFSDQSNRTLVNMTHPDQVDLENNTLIYQTQIGHRFQNLTLSLHYIAQDTTISIWVTARVWAELCVDPAFTPVTGVVFAGIGVFLLWWGYKKIDNLPP